MTTAAEMGKCDPLRIFSRQATRAQDVHRVQKAPGSTTGLGSAATRPVKTTLQVQIGKDCVRLQLAIA